MRSGARMWCVCLHRDSALRCPRVDTLLGGSSQERAERMVSFGIPLEIATLMAPHQGPEMGRAILLLYRSARQPTMVEAGRALENAAARPGLSLQATEDPFVGSDELRQRAAGRAGAAHGIT